MLLQVEDLTLHYVNQTILNHVTFSIDYKEKIGVIGHNGSGKSTLLKVIAGIEEPEMGTITKKKIDRISYLPQTIEESIPLTIQDYLRQDRIMKPEDELSLNTILNKLGMSNQKLMMNHLSGGEKKRVLLAKALAEPCELLILDEPTNHLDSTMIEWLEKYLIKFSGAILMVTHDRYFLERVTKKMIELENGQATLYEANYQKYLILKLEQATFLNHQEQKRKAFLKKELEWIKRAPQARASKDKKRIENFYDISSNPYQKKRNLDTMVDVFVPIERRLGKKIIEASHISKSFHQKKVIQDFTYFVSKEDRIGIIGANGSGKSTLLNLLSLDLVPDSGKVSVGDTVVIGYFKQGNEIENPKQRVIDFITETALEYKIGSEQMSATKLLEQFLFEGDKQFQPIEKLSGGEKRRLLLLKTLLMNPNVLFLDEPTNDLDIETLQILEEMIAKFQGPVFIVSHDRYFLDKTVSTIFSFEEDGKIEIYLGNYQDYIMKSKDKQIPISVETKKKIERKKMQTKVRLTYQEQKELETIEDEITELEEEVKKGKENLAKKYANYLVYSSYLKEQEVLEQKLEEKMNRWEYLNEKLEQSKNNYN